jgi:uncharacterized protein (DUF433 family)
MAVEITYPHIDKAAGQPARLDRVPRVRVAPIVMDYLAHGWSAQEMCRQHPYLNPAEVHSALAYYFDHQGELDAEIEDELKQIGQLAPGPESPFAVRMRAKGIL